MRIHTDHLLPFDFQNAAEAAGVRLVSANLHGSRSRRRAYEVQISGSGCYGGQWGSQDYKVAIWDEWGMFLAHLYRQDGQFATRHYKSGNHFHWTTTNRFRSLTPSRTHVRHRWTRRSGLAQLPHRTFECSCGAQIQDRHRQREFV